MVLEEIAPEGKNRNEQDFPATISPEAVMLEHDVSYTIYARPRPIRTALVLDTTVFREGTWRCEALFDGIVASAVESWGGRSNPIVVIEADKDLSVDQWKRLEASDPDRIQAFAALSDAWVQRFDARLMPWSITVDTQTDQEEPKGNPPRSHGDG